MRFFRKRLYLFLASSIFVVFIGSFFYFKSYKPQQKPLQKSISHSVYRPTMRFEKNMGQIKENYDFLCKGKGLTIYTRSSELLFQLPVLEKEKHQKKLPINKWNTRTDIVRMEIVGADSVAKVTGIDSVITKTNYMYSANPENWIVDIPNYKKVKYQDVYPGIDMLYYGRDNKLEFDFIIEPGSSPENIVLDFKNADRLKREKNGDLFVYKGNHRVVLPLPEAFQEINEQMQHIPVQFALTDDKRASFEIGNYDKNKTLIIDPKVVYSTYLGGTSTEHCNGIVVDGSGDIYITGTTISYNFPTADNTPNPRKGGTDVYVAKLKSDGSDLIYTTFLCGSQDDISWGIALDGDGNALVAGYTMSRNFPVKNAKQPNYKGDEFMYGDGFVAKINPEGNDLVYATYLGGDENDCIYDIATDAEGNVYVTGETNSEVFPVKNALFPTRNGSLEDAFVCKINPSGTDYVYCTYLGGRWGDTGYGIAVDREGNAYVTGSTISDNFPITKGSYQTEKIGGCFVSKLRADGGSLIYSTYLGGLYEAWIERATGIDVDDTGCAYVVGYTPSTSFPVVNAVQPEMNGGYIDGFLVKVKPDGTDLLFSSYLGGNGMEGDFFDVALAENGIAYVSGNTRSANIKLVDAWRSSLNGLTDAFVMKIDTEEPSILFSTYVGGSGWEGSVDRRSKVAVDNDGSLYLVGSTNSSDFPTENPLQSASGGATDIFIVKFEGDVKWSINYNGVAIDPDNPYPSLTPERSFFNDIQVNGENLDNVTDVVLQPSQNIHTSDIIVTSNSVQFDLEVRHTTNLGERDLIFKTDDNKEINVSNKVGKFTITRARTFFNQAIDARKQKSPYMHKLVAHKDGVVRLRIDDPSLFGIKFKGQLKVQGIDATTFSVFDYTAKNAFSSSEMVNGKDFLTIPFPKPFKAGKRIFSYWFNTTDEKLRILGPEISRDILDSKPVVIVCKRYRVRKGDGTFLNPPPEHVAQDALSLMKRFYPISTTQLDYRYLGETDMPSGVHTTEVTVNGNKRTILTAAGKRELVLFLDAELFLANSEAREQNKAETHFFVALMPNISLSYAGYAYLDMPVAVSATVSETKSAKKVVPHEIGHIFGTGYDPFSLGEDTEIQNLGDEYQGGYFICHVNPPVQELVSKKNTSCNDSPYLSGRDGDVTGLYTDMSAFDPVEMKPKFTDKTLIPGIIHYNFMGGGKDDNTWVSPEMYSKLLKYLVSTDGNFMKSQAIASKMGSDALIVRGVIYENDTAEFFRCDKTSTTTLTFDSAGPYSIEIRDAADNLLISQNFDVDFIPVGDPPEDTDHVLFKRTVTFPQGSKKIILKKNETILASRVISDHPPVISINQISQTGENAVSLKWSASDADNDPLDFTIVYAPDNGPVYPVTTGLSETEYVWNNTAFPGCLSGKMIVYASDKIYTAKDQISLTFSIPTKPPKLTITNPKDNFTLANNDILVLTAQAYDAEDGLLPETSIQFTSTLDGLLGTGSPLVVQQLSNGSHTIQATVTDSDGNIATDEIVVTSIQTGIVFLEEQSMLPKDFLLYQNFPNPFNSFTSIRFALPEAQHICLKLYDIRGREVKVIMDSWQSAGYHDIQVDGSPLASGVYFYRLTSDKWTKTNKMLMIK